MKSVFTDKATIPTEKDLEIALGVTYNIWQNLSDFTKKTISRCDRRMELF